jgi:hypothetical protein
MSAQGIKNAGRPDECGNGDIPHTAGKEESDETGDRHQPVFQSEIFHFFYPPENEKTGEKPV